MCLQIPLRVTEVEGDKVMVESRRVLINKDNKKIRPGDFVYAFGNLVVDRVSSSIAQSIRKKLPAFAERSGLLVQR